MAVTRDWVKLKKSPVLQSNGATAQHSTCIRQACITKKKTWLKNASRSSCYTVSSVPGQYLPVGLQPSEDHSNPAATLGSGVLSDIYYEPASESRDLTWQLENTEKFTLMLGPLRTMPVPPLALNCGNWDPDGVRKRAVFGMNRSSLGVLLMTCSKICLLSACHAIARLP
jgi:hypothetical protein